VIEVTDIFEGEQTYYIMELLRGEALSELLEREPIDSLDRVLSIAMQLADALAAVHDEDIVHCDVKPANIFVTGRDGQPEQIKLLDFGIAELPGEQQLPEHRDDSALKGRLSGTPAFMSPEQVEGKPVDQQTDIYSFGVLLYQLITRRLPFVADTLSDMAIKHLSVTPTAPTEIEGLPFEIPPALNDLILHCLEKDPGQRPISMREIDFRINQIRGEMSAAEEAAREQAEQEEQAEPPASPNWLRIAIPAAAVVLLGAAGIWLFGGESSPQEPVPEVAQTPAAAEQVSIAFDSAPKGALIFGEGDAKTPLGVTPTSLSFDKAAKERTFILRMDGYQDATQTVSLQEDGRVVVPLKRVVAKRPPVKPKAPVAPPPPTSSKNKKRARDRNAVKDPFDD